MSNINAFPLTLPSNSSSNYYSDNKANLYKTQLPYALDLDGCWEAALTKITYPHNWYNISERAVIILLANLERPTGNNTRGHCLDSFGITLSGNQTSHYIQKSSVMVEKGYYEGMSSLVEKIQKQLTDDGGKIKLRFSKFDQRVHISVTSETYFVIISYGKQLEKALGFEFTPAKDNDIKLKLLPGESSSTLPTILNRFPTLYIYSDIVEHQIVGDTTAPLLATIPITGRHGEDSTFIPNVLSYVPLKKGYKSTVEVQLSTDTGDLAPFHSGKTILELYLRRCGLVL